MRNIKSYIAILLICVGTLSSCILTRSTKSTNEKVETRSQHINYVVEAENMDLFEYQIREDISNAGIKLNKSKGSARSIFRFPSGRYDIDVCYLSDSVGQNTYIMYVANSQIVAWLGKTCDEKWHMLSEQRWHIPQNIEISKGDEIRIEGLSEKGSSASIDYITFTPSSREKTTTVKDQSQNLITATYATSNLILPQENMVTIYPNEYDMAFKNPLKGFRSSKLNHEYGTLIKTYLRWNELEDLQNDDVNKIIEVCNKKWEGFRELNIKAIPRVYIDWPKQKNGWPSDMPDKDYCTDQFKERVIAMIKKIGVAWDNDPRVAYVEMGLIGQWGEMEFPDTRDDITKAIAKAFANSFKNKLVMIRWPNTYDDHIYNFGYYWDSFAHINQEYYQYSVENTTPKWKTAVIGGECAYDWGNVNIQPGKNPDASLTNLIHRDYIVGSIRKLHANHLGWISSYTQSIASAGAAIVQKALGYRFVLKEVSYLKNIKKDFYLSFKIINTGSSPFYYNWPVEVSLLDPTTKQVVWSDVCKNVDIRHWLPGDNWNSELRAYTTPADTYSIEQYFTVPTIKPGEYIIALSILDPTSNLPCVRFAIGNYYKGGRHPIGKIGVGRVIDSFQISDFDDLKDDNSLFY